MSDIDHSLSLEIHANFDDYSLYSRVHDLECELADEKERAEAAEAKLARFIQFWKGVRAKHATSAAEHAEACSEGEDCAVYKTKMHVAGVIEAQLEGALAEIGAPEAGLVHGSKIPWSDVRPIQQPQTAQPSDTERASREHIQQVISTGMENGESSYWIADDLMDQFTILKKGGNK